MAEPFAAAVFEEERKAAEAALPDPTIQPTGYTPVWEQTPTISRGDEQRRVAQVAADNTWSSGKFITTAPDTFTRSMRSGSNVAYQAIRSVDRAYESGPIDPTWRASGADEWNKINKIDENEAWRYKAARNKDEAENILADKKMWAEDAKILADRHGLIQTVAWGLPMIMDLDTPLTLGAGALLSGTAKAAINASKFGAIAAGGIGGAATGGGMGALQYATDPNSDWTVIPLAGLAGLTFGAVGGAFGRTAPKAMEARDNVLNELGESMADGNVPRARYENLDNEVFDAEDNYLSQAFEEDLRKEEMRLGAEKDVKASGAGKQEDAVDADFVDITDIETEIPDGPRGPRVFDVGDTSGDAGSIGARNLNPTGPGVASIQSTQISNIIQTAQTRNARLGISSGWIDGWRNIPQYAQGVGRQMERFHNFVSNSPLASDFARLMNSGSAVATMLGFDLMENGAGIVRNGRSGARLQEHFHKSMGRLFLPFDEAFTEYARNQGAGMWRQLTDVQLKDQFNREVATELATRLHDGMEVAQGAVKKAADAINATHKRELEIAQGRPGEFSIKGSETLTPRSGYFHQRWLGGNMKKLERAGYTKKDIVDAIAENYQKIYRHMTPDEAQIYADAVVTRARYKDDGGSANLIGTLQGDGRDIIKDGLIRNGMTEQEADHWLDRLRGNLESKGQPGWSKGRLDTDVRFTASNGISMMDLLDTDFSTSIPARIRKSAGLSALARKGIRSRQDWNDIVSAIIEEQNVRGPSQSTGTGIRDRISDAIDSDKPVDKEFLEGVYSYFNGTPVAGGISPMFARMKKLTNLALLNQLGLTSIAELGPTMAAVGLESFFRHAGESLTGALRNAESELVAELRHMDILVPEEKMFRADLVHDIEKSTTQSEGWRHFDRVLNKAQYVQGYTSGFNQIRNFQQRIAVSSAADRLARHFKEGGLVSDARLYDMGFDKQFSNRLKNYVDHGIVEFDGKWLKKLNLDQWDPDDAEMFSMILNQQTNTLVQKAMAGESSMIFHKDGMAQLFFHLKSFPLLALEKQFLRGSRMMDPELAMTFMYGMGTAAAAYTVRQTINGRTDRLDYDDIAKGAFGYSNLTGWIPMWTDPLAGMLGMDSLKMGGRNPMGNEVLSIPAAFTTLDRVARIPGAIGSSIVNGGPSNSDINALSATPIIGNLYGFGYMWTKLRQDNTEEKARQRKEGKERAKQYDAVKAAQAAGGEWNPGGIMGMLQSDPKADKRAEEQATKISEWNPGGLVGLVQSAMN